MEEKLKEMIKLSVKTGNKELIKEVLMSQMLWWLTDHLSKGGK